MDGEIRAEFDRIHDEEKRVNKRLEGLEAKADNLESLTLSVKELAINSKYTAQKVDAIDSRLAVIEGKPAKALESVKSTAFDTFVKVFVTALITSLFWLIINHGGI